MPDLDREPLRDILWRGEPSEVGFSMHDVHRRAGALRRRRRRVQGALSGVVALALTAAGLWAVLPTGDDALLDSGRIELAEVPGSPPPAVGEAHTDVEDETPVDPLDPGCIQLADPAARRGTVLAPLGLGIQTAIEEGLVEGWTLAGPLWQLAVSAPDSSTTWWTAAPVQASGVAAVAVWVSPDPDATLQSSGGERSVSVRDVTSRPDEVHLYAGNDLARTASIWGDADGSGYAASGLTQSADDRVAWCAASTAAWATAAAPVPRPSAAALNPPPPRPDPLVPDQGSVVTADGLAAATASPGSLIAESGGMSLVISATGDRALTWPSLPPRVRRWTGSAWVDVTSDATGGTSWTGALPGQTQVLGASAPPGVPFEPGWYHLSMVVHGPEAEGRVPLFDIGALALVPPPDTDLLALLPSLPQSAEDQRVGSIPSTLRVALDARDLGAAVRVENTGADPLELAFIMSQQYGGGIWVPGAVVAEEHQGAVLAPGEGLRIQGALADLDPTTVHQLYVVATPVGSDPAPSSVSATVYAGGTP